ncbi:MAG: hypothetical protein GX601_17180 [Anaerolineales bacterium]|nr:hypothetical protein [Anaerolineales bacterium]
MLYQRHFPLSLFALGVLLLAACTPQIVTVTVTAPPETVVVTATPSPAPTATPEPDQSKVLTVCLLDEPDTLYLYGGSRLPAALHVMAALYDGPIDYVNGTYQPVILEALPSLADGSAAIRKTWVRAGDRVVDANGQVVELVADAGTLVRPAGCYDPSCVVTFEDEPLEMGKMEVTFTLREDVTWADGEPVTSADSVFAFEVATDPKTPIDHFLTDRTFQYRALSAQRVRWIGLPGFIDRDYTLNFFAPLPRHQLAGRTAAELLRAEDTRRTPLGWGPFVVQEWLPGEQITLAPNPNYFRASEGLPMLDQVVFRFSAGPAETVAELLAGRCDVAPHDDFADLAPFLLEAERQGQLTILTVTATEAEWLDIAIAPDAASRRASFFEDARVRRALAQCIDRRTLADALTFERGVVPAGLSLGTVATQQWPYNPTAGRRLLEEAGWLDGDGDGILNAADVAGVEVSTPFAVTLSYAVGDPLSEQTARIVRANLMDCGISSTLSQRLPEDMEGAGVRGLAGGRGFELAVRSRALGEIEACQRYLTSEIPSEQRPDGANITGFSDPDYDAACEAVLRGLPGSVAFEQKRAQVQAVFGEMLPAIPLFTHLRMAITAPKVLNLSLDSTCESELWQIETVDIEQ